MADPLAVVGSIGAICNIVDTISKSIAIIIELRARWKDVDLILISLASQLGALRAALGKIQDWVDGGIQDIHHQLVMDLDVSISCCNLLVDRIETFFSKLKRTPERPLDLATKLKAAFGSANVDEVQKLIERQTSALTLLLTACNCETMSEQKRLLEKSKTRKALGRAKKDTDSMLVHRDAASFCSRWTDNLSKLSAVFAFDTIIFSSPVYQRVFRGSLKDTLRTRSGLKRNSRVHSLNATNIRSDIYVTTDIHVTSEQSVKTAPNEPYKPKQQSNLVLLLGDDENGKSELINWIRERLKMSFSEGAMTRCRYQLMESCIDRTRVLIDLMGLHDTRIQGREFTKDFRTLFEDARLDANRLLDEPFQEAILSLWQAPDLPAMVADWGACINSAEYFTNEVKRVTSSDFVPTDADVLKALSGHDECLFNIFVGGKTHTLLNVPERMHYLSNGLHNYSKTASHIIFVIDLMGCYRNVSGTLSGPAKTLKLWSDIVKVWAPEITAVTVVFNNADEFERNFTEDAFKTQFADYHGGDPLAYFMNRFRDTQARRTRQSVMRYRDDSDGLQSVFDMVRESVSIPRLNRSEELGRGSTATEWLEKMHIIDSRSYEAWLKQAPVH